MYAVLVGDGTSDRLIQPAKEQSINNVVFLSRNRQGCDL